MDSVICNLSNWEVNFLTQKVIDMKQLLTFLFFIVFLTSNLISYSQKSENIYLKGTIEADPDFIEVIIIVDNSDTIPEASIFIPGQFLYDMKANKTEIISDSLYIKFKRMGSEYHGIWNTDSMFYQGYWKQAGKEFPTNLKTIDKSETANFQRPQTPEPPFNYVIRDYKVENKKGNSVLAGTLTIPDTTGVYPLVILVSGSGAQDRNEEIAGHKPFLILADYLTNNGIAVFRYDDRGFAESTGDIMNSTTYDFMTDVLAIAKFFESNPNIDNSRIGLSGHSEGGIIAMMLAAKYPKNVDFIISMAGPGVDSKSLLVKQIEDIHRANGMDEQSIEILHSMQVKLMNVPEESKGLVELRKNVTKLYEEYGKMLTEEQREKFGINQQGINNTVMQFSYPWMKYFLSLDPADYLKKIKCPVLAINGSKDIQVDADSNLAAIEENLSNGKCKYFKIEKLEGLNHLFQHADKGTVEEYFTIQHSMAEEPMILIKDFILGLPKE